jgi:hypothetical protein
MYFTLPEEVGRTWLAFQNLPREHLGAPLTSDKAEDICGMYVKYLKHVVQAAELEFSG